jgi:predicted  nucleic acid-binding Zn-ribbon protein
MHPDLEQLARLHDLDLLVEEVESARYARFSAEVGLPAGSRDPLARERQRLAGDLDRELASYYRWLQTARPRPIVALKDGVCQGCFVRRSTRAASARPGAGVERCEKCGRILFREP